MEIFFNELSAKQATNNNEAKQWIRDLVLLCKLIKRILDAVNNQLTIRTTNDFQVFQITATDNLTLFLQNNYGFTDPDLIIFLSILSNPHIDSSDKHRDEYEYFFVEEADNYYDNAGIIAAYLKKNICH